MEQAGLLPASYSRCLGVCCCHVSCQSRPAEACDIASQDKQELHDALRVQEGSTEQALSALQALVYDTECARQQAS